MSEKIKTTILLDKTLKKLAQVYAIQHDMCLGEVIEVALRNEIIEREASASSSKKSEKTKRS